MVALAGRPNVGKSTLANALSGVHLAAVSPRPQTTRRRIAMAVHGDGWQAVLLDIPGFQTPRDGLTRRMQATVDDTLADCDAAIVMLNAQEAVGAGDRFIAERVRAAGIPAIVVVNKTDASDPGAIARAIAQGASLVPDFRAVHPVSALTGEGLDALRAGLPEVLPEGPAYFPGGLVTDQTPEEVAAELIREAALVRLRDEVPHSIAVQIEDISASRGGGVRVEAVVLVETDSQKGIVVGKGGAMIREIGTAARRALTVAWGYETHLDLFVRVRRRWRDDDGMLDRLGM
ncbi:MAG: GTPase Era [Thermoleophilia bacterium]|nr:GTPase Era [Thermoleophilia bacterium]